MLLEIGADPRIHADDGALPEHVSVKRKHKHDEQNMKWYSSRNSDIRNAGLQSFDKTLQ